MNGTERRETDSEYTEKTAKKTGSGGGSWPESFM